jgi:hypothetical protein
MAQDTEMKDVAQAALASLEISDEALRQFKDPGDDEKSVDDLCAASVHTSFSKLFLSEKYHDIIIECGGREFKAHRAVVCLQCPWFEKEFAAIAKVAYSEALRELLLTGDSRSALSRSRAAKEMTPRFSNASSNFSTQEPTL